MVERIRLNDKFVRSVEPGTKRLKVKDSEVRGLYAYIEPTGARAFYLVGTVRGGRAREYRLGDATILRAADARAKALELKAQLAAGICPIEDARRREREAVSLAEIIERYLHEHERGQLPRQSKPPAPKGHANEALIGRHVADIIGHVRVDHIGIEHVRQVQADLQSRDYSRSVLRKAHGLGLRVMRYAAASGLATTNPFAMVEGPSAGAPRDRVLTPDEIRAIWGATYALRNKAYGALVRFLICVPARLDTGRRLEWSKIDFDAMTFESVEQNKIDAPRWTFAFGPTARMVLEEVGTRRSGFVFAAPRDRRKPVVITGHTKPVLDTLCGADLWDRAWTHHDFRRTVSTLSVDADLPDDAAAAEDDLERWLGHVRPGIRRVYNRAIALPAQRRACARWERVLRPILGLDAQDETVVRLPTATR